MNPKTLNVLLKHAGWFSRKPKWETDPNWKDDPEIVRDWYDKVGYKNMYSSNDYWPRGKDAPMMDPEEFYALLNRHKFGYLENPDENQKRQLRDIKEVLDLLKKKQKGGVGPEAYKFFTHHDPFWTDADIDDYVYSDGTYLKLNIFGDDAPMEDLQKLLQRQYDRDAIEKGYDPESLRKAIE